MPDGTPIIRDIAITPAHSPSDPAPHGGLDIGLAGPTLDSIAMGEPAPKQPPPSAMFGDHAGWIFG